MKVIHLIDHLGTGGSQATLVDQVEARSPDVHTSVWSLRSHSVRGVTRRLHQAGVPPRSLGIDVLHLYRALAVREALSSENPDVLHAHLDYASVAGPALASTMGATRPAVLLHLDNHADMQYSPGIRWLIGRLAPRIDSIVAVSDGVRRAAEEGFAVARRIEVIRPGIELQRFRPERANGREVASLRKGGSRVIGTVARLVEQKAVQVLLDAAGRLIGEGLDLRVLIVGDGPQQTMLQGRVKQLGIDEKVDFLGYREDVVSAYAAMDVFVLPSRFEGFGIVFLEAMAMGVPVVGTRVVGSEEAVQEGKTGLLVQSDDAPALAAAVRRLLEDPDLARKLRRGATDWISRHGSRDRMVSRTEDLYARIAEERRRRIHGANR